MAEFNYDPTGQQRYILGDVLSPWGKAMIEYFSGVPTMEAQVRASPQGLTKGLIENPDWNPTEYRAGYGLEYDPNTGIVTQNLGQTSGQVQNEAAYRANAVAALNQLAGQAPVTPELQAILDNMPKTLTDQQAEAFYQQMGFQPEAMKGSDLAAYNWWLGRGTDFNDPVSGGQGFWSDAVATGRDKDPTGTQYQNMQAFIKANPGLFLDNYGTPAEPLNIDQDLLQPFLESALFDAGNQGIAGQDSPLLDLAQLGVNRVLPGYEDKNANPFFAGGTNYDDAAAVNAAGGLFDGQPQAAAASPVQKVDTQAGQTPTLGLFGAPSYAPQGLLGGEVNGVPQNWWEGNTFMQPPINFSTGPRKIYKAGTFDTETVSPDQVADLVSPGTVQAPASIISGALAQAGQDALNGGTNAAGQAFRGNIGLLSGFNGPATGPAFSGKLSGLGAELDAAFPSATNSFADLPMGRSNLISAGGTLLGAVAPPLGYGISALNAINGGRAEAAKQAVGPNDGDIGASAWLSGATGGLLDFDPRSGGIGGSNTPGQGGYAGFMNYLDPGVSGPARSQASMSIPGYEKPAYQSASPSSVQSASLQDVLGGAGWNDALSGLLASLPANSPILATMSPGILAQYGYNSGPVGGTQSYFAGGI